MSFKENEIETEIETESEEQEYERLFKERRVLYKDENIDNELIEKINFKPYIKKEERFKYLDKIFNPNKDNKPSMRELVERNINEHYKNNFANMKKLKIKNPKISFEEAILRTEKKHQDIMIIKNCFHFLINIMRPKNLDLFLQLHHNYLIKEILLKLDQLIKYKKIFTKLKILHS